MTAKISLNAARRAELPSVAYFSMEIGLENDVPTYSGGLGVLAGDTVRSAADLGVPMVAITLLYRKGYFRQALDDDGNQTERPVEWRPEDRLDLMDATAAVKIEGREVSLRAWRYLVEGIGGHAVPVYLLDADVEGNSDEDRQLTDTLYGGDERYRLCQETILGIGGVRMLRALGHADLDSYHMNEGHSALLTVELIRDAASKGGVLPRSELEALRQRCVFTTHTPVPAGHDEFPTKLVKQVVSSDAHSALSKLNVFADHKLNMTRLALECSNYVNGVAKIHQNVSQAMFPNYRIRAVTNGVHAATWTSRPFRRLFDEFVPEWRYDNVYLRYAIDMPREEVAKAHEEAKADLFAAIQTETGETLDPAQLTIGFARRATPYKRSSLLFHDLERLRWIVDNIGPFQLVYGGKAHPRDEGGKELIRRVFEAAEDLRDKIRLVYVPNYEMDWGRLITSGVDVWLNTPEKTREASGTSGMKAALNGVPSLSVLDGWWLEGHVENVTGWSVANRRGAPDGEATVAHSLYDKLERLVIPMYYERPNDFTRVRRSAIALNAAFFNTHRMVSQYLFNAYGLRETPPEDSEKLIA